MRRKGGWMGFPNPESIGEGRGNPERVARVKQAACVAQSPNPGM
jgi:hypothetical protein